MKLSLGFKAVQLEQLSLDLLEEKRNLDEDSHDYHGRVLALNIALSWLDTYRDVLYLDSRMGELSREGMAYDMAHKAFLVLSAQLAGTPKPSRFYSGPHLADLKILERMDLPSPKPPKKESGTIGTALNGYSAMAVAITLGFFIIYVPYGVLTQLGMESQALVWGFIGMAFFITGTKPLSRVAYALHKKFVEPVFKGKGYLW